MKKKRLGKVISSGERKERDGVAKESYGEDETVQSAASKEGKVHCRKGS